MYKIKFSWDEESAKSSFEELYRYEFNHSAKRYIGWFFIALLQYGIVGAILKGKIAILIFATVMLFYWYYGKKYIAKKRFLKDNKNKKDISIMVDDDGITFEDGTKWLWSEIDKVEDVAKGLLIIKHPKHYFLPSKAFSSFEEKTFIKNHIAKINT